METNIERNIAKNQNQSITQIENDVNNIQIRNSVNNTRVENKAESKTSVNYGKKPLTPYQQYKNSRNQNGKKYFEFYDDVKVYTHNIWDW